MIRFGPAGIPLSCKGRTLRDGIIDMHHIGLTAMEVQFIKVNSAQREVLPEEVGKLPREIPEHLIVEVQLPGKGGSGAMPEILDRPLAKRSQVTTLNWFLAKDYSVLTHARALARSVDVRLSMHAPFYVDFLTNPGAADRSRSNYLWSSAIASALGVDVMVGHMGFYGPDGPEASLERIIEEMKGVRHWMDSLPGGHKILLGIEPNGHPEVLGTRQEVLEIARKVPRSIPVLNIPHIAVREGTTFEERKDLEALFEEFRAATPGDLYLNFSGVMVQGKGSFRMTPIKRGAVKFENVAEVLAERNFDATVISSSPLMEHDAMYMKLLHDRALAKLFQRRAAKAEAAKVEKAAKAVKQSAAKAPAKGSAKHAPAPKVKPKAGPKAKPAPKKAKGGGSKSHGRQR